MEIPIIIPDKSKKGYWETYFDHKIWHDESGISKEMSFKNYKEIGKEYNTGGGEWMQLAQGDNKVRIVSDFKPYGSHYNPKTNKSTICLGKEDCPICKAGNKPRVQFLGWVIDRTDNQVKLLRFGYKVFGQIGKIASSEEYEFDTIPNFDITITKTGEGLETDYSTLASRKDTVITNEEQAMINEKVGDPQDVIDKMKAKVMGGEQEMEEKTEGEEENIIQEDDLMDALSGK